MTGPSPLASPETPAEPPLALERKPRTGLELELTLETLGERGRGRGFVESEIGPQRLARRYSVDVRGGLPGERVRARVERVHRRKLEAQVLVLLTADAARQTPRCRHFGAPPAAGPNCGGCVLQQVPHDRQLAFKSEALARLLEQTGFSSSLLRPPRAPREPWYYRNKMEFSFAGAADGTLELGLHPPGYKYEVLPLDECHLLSPESSRLLPRIGAWCRAEGLRPFRHREAQGFLRSLLIREGKRTGERMVELLTSDDETVETARGPRPAADVAQAFGQALGALGRELDVELSSVYWTRQHAQRGTPTRFVETLLYGAPTLHEELHITASGQTRSLRFEIHPRAFFQPNTLQAEVLYGEVLRAAGLLDEQPDALAGKPRALDLYCGTGTIALCLAPFVEEVIGAELNAEAVENAQRNALYNGIENVRFHAGDVGALLDGALATERGRIDFVVVDPPRTGLLPAALEHLARIRAPRLVYVSCNPEALVRDLKSLRRVGLEARWIQPVDMFPHTGHIENVALLTRERT